MNIWYKLLKEPVMNMFIMSLIFEDIKNVAWNKIRFNNFLTQLF